MTGKRGGAREGAGRRIGSVNKVARDLRELAQTRTTTAIEAISSIMTDQQLIQRHA